MVRCFGLQLLPLLHCSGMKCPGDTLVLGSTEEFGVDIETTLLRRFFLLDRNAVRVGPGILTNASHLP